PDVRAPTCPRCLVHYESRRLFGRMAQLLAVVERRGTPDGQGAPWPTTPLPADRFVRLSGATSEQEVGAVAWQLVLYNHLSTDEPLRAASTAKNLVLPGGLAVEE